jgi:hypothetical protein
MNERRRLAVRHLFAALVVSGLGVVSLGASSMGCVSQEFGVGSPCVQDSDCFTKKCVSLVCAANNAASNVPFPTIDAAPPADAEPVDASDN